MVNQSFEAVRRCRFKEAERLLSKLKPDEITADTRVVEARLLFEQGKLEAACAAIEAVNSNELHYEWLVEKILIELSLAQYDAAGADFGLLQAGRANDEDLELLRPFVSARGDCKVLLPAIEHWATLRVSDAWSREKLELFLTMVSRAGMHDQALAVGLTRFDELGDVGRLAVAYAFYMKRDFQQAIAILNGAEYTEDLVNRRLLVHCLKCTSKWLAAETVAREILKEAPDWWDVQEALAIALLAQRKWNPAREHLEQAFARRPDLPIIFISLALLYVLKGRLLGAVKVWAAGARANASHVPDCQATEAAN